MSENSNKKKTILWVSNSPSMKTGFGQFTKLILTYLYKTGKYNIVNYASQVTYSSSDFARWPWRSFGTLPDDPKELQQIMSNEALARFVNYGSMYIGKVLKEAKPDIAVYCEDIWMCKLFSDAEWWNKFSNIVHTTLDSEPIWPDAYKIAAKTPHFFAWAEFATKIMNQWGATNVKTLRGAVATDVFRRLPDEERLALRKRAGIPENAFCIGFMCRNQLRKSVPNLLKAFKIFQEKHPDIDVRLLLYTNYGEGWNIQQICSEKDLNIDQNKILVCYKCKATGKFYLLPFQGNPIDNPEHLIKNSMATVNIVDGLTTEQVCQWFNHLNVYIHPFSSGGQEVPVQEAKLCELIVACTDYSCGQDMNVPEAASLPLSWHEYREPNDAAFIKATTDPDSIVKQLEAVLNMPELMKRDMGRRAREWVLKNFSIEIIGKKFEDLFDSLPFTTYDFNFEEKSASPNAEVDYNLIGKEFITHCYSQILNRDPDDGGFEYWDKFLAQSSAPEQQMELRKKMVEAFRTDAHKVNARREDSNYVSKWLGPEPAEQRVLISMPQSMGDCLYLTCLLKDARELYPSKTIYVATAPVFMEIFEPLIGTYIDRVIPWVQELDDVNIEGSMGGKKHFQIALHAHFPTQRTLSYRHNGEDKTKIDLQYATH